MQHYVKDGYQFKVYDPNNYTSVLIASDIDNNIFIKKYENGPLQNLGCTIEEFNYPYRIKLDSKIYTGYHEATPYNYSGDILDNSLELNYRISISNWCYLQDNQVTDNYNGQLILRIYYDNTFGGWYYTATFIPVNNKGVQIFESLTTAEQNSLSIKDGDLISVCTPDTKFSGTNISNVQMITFGDPGDWLKNGQLIKSWEYDVDNSSYSTLTQPVTFLLFSEESGYHSIVIDPSNKMSIKYDNSSYSISSARYRIGSEEVGFHPSYLRGIQSGETYIYRYNIENNTLTQEQLSLLQAINNLDFSCYGGEEGKTEFYKKENSQLKLFSAYQKYKDEGGTQSEEVFWDRLYTLIELTPQLSYLAQA